MSVQGPPVISRHYYRKMRAKRQGCILVAGKNSRVALRVSPMGGQVVLWGRTHVLWVLIG